MFFFSVIGAIQMRYEDDDDDDDCYANAYGVLGMSTVQRAKSTFVRKIFPIRSSKISISDDVDVLTPDG